MMRLHFGRHKLKIPEGNNNYREKGHTGYIGSYPQLLADSFFLITSVTITPNHFDVIRKTLQNNFRAAFFQIQ